MAHVLHLDSSPRGARSHTRRLTREFVDMWRRRHPGDTVSRRDLGMEPPPHITEGWIAAAFCAPEARTPDMHAELSLSEHLVDELLAAGVLVIGVPMYNFAIPAMLKVYIDQIVRIGRTFAFEPEDTVQPYKPLTYGKRAFVIVASGDAGYDPGGPLAELNHVEPYLRTVLGFIGIRDVDFVYVGNDEFGGERLERSLEIARSRVGHLAASRFDPPLLPQPHFSHAPSTAGLDSGARSRDETV
ncbi:MAG: FMN-dependent NADH-azoreductase [Luteitalea sp.]|nr:FMN-dependent NADH-azoreductase [Luteitalea sp.]